ncbi:MAG: hypothetical protein K0B05_13775, partial [Bacteroidales bacterium]|nr:hypothetical protein [Bacteroidales bacterium]
MKKTRRTFIKNAVMGTAGTFAIPDLIPSYLPGKTAPSKRINIGVIGIGRQTVNPNIPQFLQSEHAQVVAVCDVDAWRLENGRIGKVERIFVAVPAELSGSALSPEPTMPVPSELNYDMWLGP